MSMAEYILKLRGHIKSVLRRKQEIRIIAYPLYAPKEHITQWMPNPLDSLDDGGFDIDEMMDAWNLAQQRHDQ